MSAIVSRRMIQVPKGNVVSAQAVASSDWRQVADAYNTLLGSPAALLPFFTCSVALSLVADITTTYSAQPTFVCWPRIDGPGASIRTRVWFWAITPGANAVTVRFTDPNGEYTDASWPAAGSSGSAGTFTRFAMHFEGARDNACTSTSIGSGAYSVQVKLGATQNCTLAAIGCLEIPRSDLWPGAGTGLLDDYAAETTYFRSGLPIDDSAIALAWPDGGSDGLGVGVPVRQLETLRRNAGRRVGIWAGYPNLSTTSGTFVNVYQGAPASLLRKHYNGDTSNALQLGAYALGSDATTTGEIRWTMTSGASVTMPIAASTGNPLIVTQIATDCESTASTDGRQFSRDDLCTVAIRRTSGAGNIVLSTHSAGEGPSASPTLAPAAIGATHLGRGAKRFGKGALRGITRRRPSMFGYAAAAAAAPPGSPTWWTKDTGISGSPIDFWTDDGTAGGNVSSSGTARPTQVTLDSHTGAQFDGVDDTLITGPAISGVISASAYTIAIVFKPIALTGASGTSYDARALVTDSNGKVGGGNWSPFSLVAAGLYGGHFDSADRVMPSAISVSTGTTYIATCKFDGSTISWACNSATQSVAAGNVGTLTNLVIYGRNYNSAVYANAEIYEVVAYSSALNGTDLASLVSYLHGRFPSATQP